MTIHSCSSHICLIIQGARQDKPTFASEEVKRPEEASIPSCWGLRTLLAQELRELSSRQIDEAGDVTQHQFEENIGVLMAKFLHKKVGVEDDGGSSVTRAPRGFVMIDHHITPCTSGGDQRRNKNTQVITDWKNLWPLAAHNKT